MAQVCSVQQQLLDHSGMHFSLNCAARPVPTFWFQLNFFSCFSRCCSSRFCCRSSSACSTALRAYTAAGHNIKMLCKVAE